MLLNPACYNKQAHDIITQTATIIDETDFVYKSRVEQRKIQKEIKNNLKKVFDLNG